MSVSLAGADGRVVGGGVAGMLTAASPVQVYSPGICLCLWLTFYITRSYALLVHLKEIRAGSSVNHDFIVTDILSTNEKLEKGYAI